MNRFSSLGETVTGPRGFLAGAVYAGIKKPGPGALDLGILYSEASCAAAGVFTSNKIKAAPVIVSRRHLARSRAQAIVVNSGCANACTGEQGLEDAERMAAAAALKLGLASEDVLVASTGVIGHRLPLDTLTEHLQAIAVSREGGHALARAIMTTDTFPKEIAAEVTSGPQSGIKVAGIAKGAGMIHPDLATLLCFLTTDARVEPAYLSKALREAADTSFNMITVDGDTSPNDSIIILANGAAGREVIQEGTPDASAFEEALGFVCKYLARAIARDGEGATKLIEVTIEGAMTLEQARAGARAIAASSLVKAAVHGSDPNWGRIIAALGKSGIEIIESGIDLYLDSTCLLKNGCPQPFDLQQTRSALDRIEVPFRVCLNIGEASATAWGCDLSEEYVTINSEYTT